MSLYRVTINRREMPHLPVDDVVYVEANWPEDAAQIARRERQMHPSQADRFISRIELVAFEVLR